MEIYCLDDCFKACDNDYSALLDIAVFPHNVPLYELKAKQRKKLYSLVIKCGCLETYLNIVTLFTAYHIDNEDKLDVWFDELNTEKAFKVFNDIAPNAILSEEEMRDFDEFVLGINNYSVPHFFYDKDFFTQILSYMLLKGYFPPKDKETDEDEE